MLSFLKNLAGYKADKAIEAGIGFYAKIDPEGLTETELRTMEEALDKLGIEVAAAQQAYDKERKEADAIAALLRQRMAAAELLQSQADAEADPARKAKLEQSLTNLLAMLEQMTPEVEREESEARDAAEFVASLQQSYKEMAEQLKGARAQLEQAQRDMKKAEMARTRADREAESARVAAGLTQRVSGLGVALKAMREQADRDNAQAQSAQMKAKLLRPTKPEQDDPDIAAALAAASGTPRPATGLSDRLAALKAKHG
ncbi:hypothetical protein HL658_29010 [Azospirillum sp. RWY-5-1]|uniref:PspA/IM30 family protein n=1 Tax=Azospirillum oleiclasticum TaxID=2735135 RepID=A0ABX2TIN2_9PROT|nr:hypothetical protein [Azospirillum oleiclasticum]NYZ16604.1 hypothetical protein [Azospirillum oleiclasticum]NYZ24091.1 hypothetical protein [Azospirillum oleiclasticum]